MSPHPSSSRPHVYGGGLNPDTPEPSPRHNPWTGDEALRREGGIILWNADHHGSALAGWLCERFPAHELLEPVTLRWKTGAELPPIRVAMALIPPASDEAGRVSGGGAPTKAGAGERSAPRTKCNDGEHGKKKQQPGTGRR